MITSFDPKGYSLPLRIAIENDRYHFEIGFPSLPKEILAYLRDGTIRIKVNTTEMASAGAETFIYDLTERLSESGLTWLSVGPAHAVDYTVTCQSDNQEVHSFWPDHVLGISEKGTLFESISGKMLVQNADVQIERNYDILLSQNLLYGPRSIQRKLLAESRSNGKTWHLYRIMATEFSGETARFFANFGCRLTKSSLTVQPIWPIWIEDPYIIYHEAKQMWFCIQGEKIETKTLPYAPQASFEYAGGNMVQIDTHERQQLVSAGRNKLLTYTWLWHSSLNQTTPLPSASVTTVKGERVPSGICHRLPERQIVRITLPQFDGSATILKSGNPALKFALKGGIPCEIPSISYGTELRVYIGLDCIWSAVFQKAERNSDNEDADLIAQLESERGTMRRIPHSLGSVAGKLRNHPAIQLWLYRKLRIGTMPETSYRLLA